MPGMDWYVAEVYLARVRFGLWAPLLAMPAPGKDLPGLRVGWLYGRGMAQAATGHITEAKASLAALEDLAKALPADASAGQNALSDVAAIARAMLEGRIAGAEHRSSDEIAALRRAVAGEDHLAYDEPKNWFAPTRHALGEALLRAGKPAEAEVAYREDLRQNPDNGWALLGLSKALGAQGRTAEAAKTRTAFHRAWARADTAASASSL
jgi:tetratricopeptide (TPR) repeat protein